MEKEIKTSDGPILTGRHGREKEPAKDAVRRVAIVGPESTGKSEMSRRLAARYDTEWVPEYARFYLDRLDRNYGPGDLPKIARGQLAWEDQKAGRSNGLLFCDTNLIVIKIWSDHKYGTTDPWIEAELKNRRYDLFLLANTDLPWQPDSQREHPELRQYFFDKYKLYLKGHDLPYEIISGIADEREKCAIDAIKHRLA